MPGNDGACELDDRFPARYEMVSQIGAGATAEVFLARQVALGRLVAVKLLTVGYGSSGRGDLSGRFRREVELLAKVNHPNVVSVYDSGRVGDRPFLVMEYIPGDLRARLRPGKPMPIGQARAILGPIAEALAFLHSLGIVHRDLKPENVLMAGPTSPKVADFGIAALLDELHGSPRHGRGLGTPGYVAPEQQYNLPTNARADQYSLAALAYEMLTGEPPLGTIRPPSSLRPSLGEAVDRVLLRALQDDPDDRFESIDKFARALDQALSSPPRPWGRRIVLAAAALMMLAGAAWLARRHGAVADSPVAVVDAPASDGPEVVDGPLGIKLVRIPPGEFWMGAAPSDEEAEPLESPRRLVKVSRPPLFATSEVTVAQFRVFVEETGWTTSAETRSHRGGAVFDPDLHAPVHSKHYTWEHPTGGARPDDDLPVTQVSHDDAVAFCDWLTERERKRGRSRYRFRLPKECEWEYACRAGSKARWCYGDDESQLSRYAHYFCKEVAREDGPFPAGGTEPNAFGLRDMHGNVGEWCLDPLVPYSGGLDLDDPKSPTHPSRRAVRGGSWTRSGKYCRSSARLAYLHTYAHYAIGFRVCAVEPNEP